MRGLSKGRRVRISADVLGEYTFQGHALLHSDLDSKKGGNAICTLHLLIHLKEGCFPFPCPYWTRQYSTDTELAAPAQVSITYSITFPRRDVSWEWVLTLVPTSAHTDPCCLSLPCIVLSFHFGLRLPGIQTEVFMPKYPKNWNSDRDKAC